MQEMLYWRGVHCIQGDHTDTCLNCWQRPGIHLWGLGFMFQSEVSWIDGWLHFVVHGDIICQCCASTHELEPVVSLSCIGPSFWNSHPLYLRTVALTLCVIHFQR